jgi:hypothetical protein
VSVGDHVIPLYTAGKSITLRTKNQCTTNYKNAESANFVKAEKLISVGKVPSSF